jgi:hypothetical protein
MKNIKLNQILLPLAMVFLATGCFAPWTKVTNAPEALTAGQTPPTPFNPTFSSSVPNADNIVARVQNALTLPTGSASLVNPAAGNFKTALGQQSSNFSSTSNPLLASGAGSIPLLSYAACSDVNATSYGVTTSGTLTSQTSAIVAAGLTIVNQCTANLAAPGSTFNMPVTQAFQNLVSNDAAASATTSQTFISVCTAATSFCVSMLGF